jgi:hypothetical protein
MNELAFRPAVLSKEPFPLDKAVATPDEVFIAHGWHREWRDSPWAGTLPHNVSFAAVLETIRQLAQRGTTFEVLESPEFDVFVGFIAFEPEVLHFVYVKDTLRERGFANLLLKASGLTPGASYTHRTRWSRYLPFKRHRPEIARRRKR